MTLLSNEQLNALPTPRLLALLRSVRSKYITHKMLSRYYYGGEPATTWEKRVEQEKKSIEEYRASIKAILDTREHVDRKLSKLEKDVFELLEKHSGLSSRDIVGELFPTTNTRSWRAKEHQVSEALSKLERLGRINGANEILTGPAKKRRLKVMD